MKTLRRKPASIPKARWAAYAAAGAATALGGTRSAEAEIHYSGVINAKFPTFADTLKHFPLDHSARLIFLNCYGYFYNQEIYYGAFFGMDAVAGSNSFRGFPAFAGYYVSRLAAGQLVSQGDFVGKEARSLGILVFGSCVGPWGCYRPGNGHPGFIGFHFDNGGGPQYGWARLTNTHPRYGAAEGFTLVDYAWGDPGDTILTGQRSSAGDMVDTVSESGSLGLLALGGAGLLAWRKRRGQATD